METHADTTPIAIPGDTFYKLVMSFGFREIPYKADSTIDGQSYTYMNAITHDIIGKYNGLKNVSNSTGGFEPVYSFANADIGTRKDQNDDGLYTFTQNSHTR